MMITIFILSVLTVIILSVCALIFADMKNDDSDEPDDLTFEEKIQDILRLLAKMQDINNKIYQIHIDSIDNIYARTFDKEVETIDGEYTEKKCIRIAQSTKE